MYCPTCAQREDWVGRVISAFEGVNAGLPLTEIAPDPTQALLDAVTLVSLEVDARSAQRQKDRSPR